MKKYTITQSHILELASELAHNAVEKSDIYPIIIDDENGDTRYTEEAQDEFNRHYDYYLTIIENILID